MPSCGFAKVWRFIFFFRLHDYLLCVACGFIAYGVSKVRPHCRPFSWTDATISYPYTKHETFPSWTLPIISILPGVAYVVCEALRHFVLAAARRGGGGGVLTRAPFTVHTWLRSDAPLREAEAGLAGYTSPTVTGPEGAVTAAAAAGPSQRMSTFAQPRECSRSPVGAADQVAVVEVHIADPPHAVDGHDTPPKTGEAAASSPSTASVFRDAPPAPASRGDTAAVAAGAGSRRPHTYAMTRPWQKFLLHAHVWVLAQAFSVTFAMLLVNAIKVYAGRLRPDFLARLQREGYSASSVDVDWCAVPKGGRVSFPSGHSGISFAAFVPLCFYVLHLLHAFRRTGASLWRTTVGLLPLILPITVAVSRTRDYRHNFDDIVTGGMIGVLSAIIAVCATMTVQPRTGQLIPRFAYGAQ